MTTNPLRLILLSAEKTKWLFACIGTTIFLSAVTKLIRNGRSCTKVVIMRGLTPDPYFAASQLDCLPKAINSNE